MVEDVKDAVKTADVCMILVPDELQADLYNDFLLKNLKENSSFFVPAPTSQDEKEAGYMSSSDEDLLGENDDDMLLLSSSSDEDEETSE